MVELRREILELTLDRSHANRRVRGRPRRCARDALSNRQGAQQMRSVDSAYDTFPISADLHGVCTELSWRVQEPFEHSRLVGTPTDTQSAA